MSISSWIQGPALITPRFEAQTFVYNGNLYVGGGYDNLNNFFPVSTIEMAPINADGSLGTFSIAGNVSQVNSTFWMSNKFVVSGNFIYAVGAAQSHDVAPTLVLVATFNPDGTIGPFRASTNRPVVASNFCFAATNNGYIYSDGDRTAGFNSQCFCYSLINGDGTLAGWNAFTPIPPVAPIGTAIFVGQPQFIGSSMILAGGNYYNATGAGTTTAVYQTTLSSGQATSWTLASNTLVPRSQGAAQIVIPGSNLLYIVGGDNSDRTATVYSSVEFAPITGTSVGAFTYDSPLPLPLTDITGAYNSGFIYVAGGTNSSTSNTNPYVYYANINNSSSSTVSPNMGLIETVPGVTPGPTYAVDVQSWNPILDQHNHTPGGNNGVQVPSAGININAALPFNTNNLTNAGTITAAQVTPVGAGTLLVGPGSGTLQIGAATLEGTINANGQTINGIGSLGITGNLTVGGTSTLTGGIVGALKEATATTSLTLTGNVAATASTATILNNAVTQTSGKITSFQAGVTEKAYIDFSGSLFQSVTATPLTLVGNPAATAGIGTILTSVLTQTSGKITSFQTNAVEKLYVDFAGSIFQSVAATPLTLVGNAASTAAIGVVLNNVTTQTSGKIAVFQTGGTEKSNIDFAGSLAQTVAASPQIVRGNAAATGGVATVLDNITTQTSGTITSFRTNTVEKANIGFDGTLNTLGNITKITTAAGLTITGNANATGTGVTFANTTDVTGTGSIAIFNANSASQFSISGRGHIIPLSTAPTAPAAGVFAAGFNTPITISLTGSDASMKLNFTSGAACTQITEITSLVTITLVQGYSATATYNIIAAYASAPTSASLSYGVQDTAPLIGVATGVNTFKLYPVIPFTPANNTPYSISIITMGAGATF